MAPSLVLEDGRPRLVVGSAGSIRLRAAILQIVAPVVDDGLSAGEAIDAPRVHLDEGVLQLEGGIDETVADGLEDGRVRRQPLGGAQPVLRRRGGRRSAPDGSLEAAGDPAEAAPASWSHDGRSSGSG